MTTVEFSGNLRRLLGDGLSIAAAMLRDIPQRLAATARLMAEYPHRHTATIGQRIKVAAKLVTDRPGPQHLEGWT